MYVEDIEHSESKSGVFGHMTKSFSKACSARFLPHDLNFT